MRAINTNVQSYEEIILHDDFYIDKTALIREWWEKGIGFLGKNVTVKLETKN